MKLVLTALCAVALLPAAASANPFASDQATIRTNDLDLSQPADQRRLELRLANAAEDVCGRGMERIHNVVKDKALACQRGVIADYKAQLDQRVAAATSNQKLALK